MLLTPLSEFDVLNLGFLAGWAVLALELCRILAADPEVSRSPFEYELSPWLERLANPFIHEQLMWKLVLLLELGCWLDVVRMLTGSLRGNWLVGVVLHAIRTFCLTVTLPSGPPGDRCHSLAHAVLLVWAVTEVCRYPCYLVSSPKLRLVRDLCPVVAFPLGATLEAIGAALFINRAGGLTSTGAVGAGVVVTVNVLGGLYAYPGMVTRAIKGLKGTGRPKVE